MAQLSQLSMNWLLSNHFTFQCKLTLLDREWSLPNSAKQIDPKICLLKFLRRILLCFYLS